MGSNATNIPMPIKARYVHTNLTARNWQKLVRFYSEVFGCVPLLPERDISGDWIDRVTNLAGAHLRGMHLALPGFDSNGPTLEIFSYDQMIEGRQIVANEPGFGHLAFLVDDVDAALTAVLAAGGGRVGEIGETDYPGIGTLRVVYARDPEGNIIELQKWNRQDGTSS